MPLRRPRLPTGPCRRRSPAVLAVVVGLCVAGCGGSGSAAAPPPGTAAAYAAAWDRACQTLTDAQVRAQREAGERTARTDRGDVDAQSEAIAEPFGRFVGALSKVLGSVHGLDAPPELRRFQARVDREVPVTIAVLRDARGAVARGDVAATQRLAGRLGAGGKVLPTLPDALQQRATACLVY